MQKLDHVGECICPVFRASLLFGAIMLTMNARAGDVFIQIIQNNQEDTRVVTSEDAIRQLYVGSYFGSKVTVTGDTINFRVGSGGMRLFSVNGSIDESTNLNEVNIGTDSSIVSIIGESKTNTSATVSNKAKLNLLGKTISIESPANAALEVSYKNSITRIGSSSTDNISIESASTATEKSANSTILVKGGTTTILGKVIELKNTAGEVVNLSTGILKIGDSNTDSISVNGVGHGVSIIPSLSSTSSSLPDDSTVVGTTLNNNGLLTLEAKTVSITATGDASVALRAQNNSTGSDTDFAQLTVNADDIYLNAQTGIVATSQGNVTLNGNSYIKANSAVYTRGLSKTVIGKADGSSTVQIEGDVNFGYANTTSTDASVVLNLNGENSYWTGNTLVSWEPNTNAPSSELLCVNGMQVNLSNGAKWNVVLGQTEEENARYVAVDSLALNDGVINLLDADVQSIEIEKLSGTGGTVNALVTLSDDNSASTPIIEVGSTVGVPAITVAAVGINADDVTTANRSAVLKALSSAVSTTEGGTSTVEKTTYIEEGDVKGAITQTTLADGTVIDAVQESNSKLAAYDATLSLGLIQWRHEMNDLTKRMGELRDSPAGIGSWARLYGSEQEYESLTAKNTSVQVGTDFDVGAGWKLGAAFSYTDGSSSDNLSESDSDMYGFALYGSWLADNGFFLDLIGKYTRLSTDFTAENMTVSYDNNAWSASAEAGWHISFLEHAFVEPQVELTYGHISGDDFVATNDVRIEQEDTDSLIGRIGLRGGFHFPNNRGTVYARASVLHDFEGEVESLAVKGNQSERLWRDLGGTWYEFGVGANFNWTENTYTYVDLERSSGGEIVENWRWNVGVRHVW